MRGEDDAELEDGRGDGGSPPHARGRLRRGLEAAVDARITPACAGKTKLPPVKFELQSDHPRMRGEDCASPSCARSRTGSPPHARGRPGKNAKYGHVARITPACAGKTFSAFFLPRSEADHPRMRGEDARSIPSRMPEGGSPPHARGRRVRRREPRPGRGITPACAGKTPRRRGSDSRTPDHPRMRGEDSTFLDGFGRRRGSPPHARGRPPIFR